LQQIEALTKTEGTKFLFGESEGFVPKGAKPGESGGGSPEGNIVYSIYRANLCFLLSKVKTFAIFFRNYS
jgi:hypothetical protein